jgi:hypothetical protein
LSVAVKGVVVIIADYAKLLQNSWSERNAPLNFGNSMPMIFIL